ncbi:hypothetical protein FACS189420_0890 [Bacteroidia bacterium]|nr:hypothetical protein FACS189420_0890 [Bacteroidia bacterium]
MKQSIVHWYAAQVRRHTEKKIKNYLENKGVEHCIPFQGDQPVIPGFVFVRTDHETALSLPAESGYKISYLYGAGTGQFQVIPDKQIENFRFISNYWDETILIDKLPNARYLGKVRVKEGKFKGIEGDLMRVKGHKRVIVKLEGVCTLAMTFIPMEYMEVIENKI